MIVYLPEIDIDVLKEKNISYEALNDYGKNQKIELPPKLKVATTIWSEGWEGSLNAYGRLDNNPSNGADYFGDVTCDKFSGSWSLWCADEGDQIDCQKYDDNMEAWVYTASTNPIYTAGYTNLKFNRYWKLSCEPSYDYVDRFYSRDFVTWDLQARTTGTYSGWQYSSSDIGAYSPTFYWWYVFFSDGSNSNYTGFFLDNMSVEGDPAPPDFIVVSVSGPSSATPGQSVNVTVQARNQGPNPTQAGSYVVLRMILSPDPQINLADIYYQDFNIPISSWNGGVTVGNNYSYTIPSGLSGTYYWGGYVDATTYWNESNENNNALAGNSVQIQCTYSISPTNASFSSSGGTGSVSVTAPSGCPWTAVSNDAWITITTGSSGSGNGSVGYSVSANPSSSPRSGTMTIAGNTFTVNQSGVSCSYSIVPTNASYSSSAGTGSVSVTVQSGCAWTAVSNDVWITITSGSSGSGNGSVGYSVSSNSSSSPRSGTMTIAGNTFTVNQSGITCSYSIFPTSASFGWNGGTDNISVTAPSGCSWTANSNSIWITITSGSSGSGNGTVAYSVAENQGTNSRSGEITVQGNVFTITQAPAFVSMQVGILTVYARTITPQGGSLYRASGSVNINNVLKFNDDVTIDNSNRTIVGNCRIYVENIPVLGTVNLYQGQFTFIASSTQQFLTGLVIYDINNLFTLTGLPVRIQNMEILSDGIRVEGSLELPDIMGHLRASLNQLQIRQSTGVGIAGNVCITSVRVRTVFELRDLCLNFNSISNEFEGSATLITPSFGISAGAMIMQGRLQSVNVSVILGTPIPIASTGLSISEGGGSVSGLYVPPMALSLSVSLVPTIQGSFNAVEFNNLTLAYTFGNSFEGRGNLRIFGHSVASGLLRISRSSASVEGNVNLINILYGSTSATVAKNLQGSLDLSGQCEARLTIPRQDGYPFDLISSVLNLPWTIASTQNQISNRRVWGSVFITRIFEVTYGLDWNGSNLSANWGLNWHLFNRYLFEARSLINVPVAQKKNRFEGQSLVVSTTRTNRGLLIKNNMMDQIFDLNVSVPAIIIRVRGELETPVVNIILPDSTVLTPDNIQTFPDAEYSILSSENKIFYVLRNPQLGQYSIRIQGSSTYYIDVFGAKFPPAIQLDTLMREGYGFRIKGNVFNPSANSTVSIYYDKDNANLDGVLIASELPPDVIVSGYLWQPDTLHTGNYYIYTKIEDGENVPRYSYSTKPITWIQPGGPNPPSSLTYSTDDSTIALSWERNNLVEVKYIVYYSTIDGIDYNSPHFMIGDTSSFTFQNFIPGRIYKFDITAIDSMNRESYFSNEVAVNFISSSNNAPSFVSQQYSTTAFPNVPYQSHIIALDPDGDPLIYSLSESPIGITINTDGVINWIPSSSQIGLNPVTVKVTDPAGLSDSVAFRITVLDSLSASSRIRCNLSTYYTYGSMVFFELTDRKRNSSTNKLDSSVVHIYSQSDPTGFDVLCFETSTNSGSFAGSFFLSTYTNNSEKLLHVSDQDSFHVTYFDSINGYMIKSSCKFNRYERMLTQRKTSGWNLLSLPLDVENGFYQTNFQNTVSRPFAYVGGYKNEDTLVNGFGYWLKFGSEQDVTIKGSNIAFFTIPVQQRWNIIGSISYPVPVSLISSEPPGLITSMFFGYDGNNYQHTDTIEPGKGYWVKVNQAGSLILSSTYAGLAKSSASHIRIMATSELPPPPPDENTVSVEIPKQFALEQNYPNPFNPITVFRYQLPIGCKVTLRIYNLLGQEIKSLVNDWQDAGYKTVEWDASNFASGVYFYRINAGSFIQTKKLILMR
ncbi:MAG: BACON domain-containing carbohydrate-binding protein [Bacteroidota bacterium]|nr:BACON domain-containing carbohydrate-binding protein [Bacteroidota bacterium]